jgi:hypothetical protein
MPPLTARAQELEPRAYSTAPVGTDFLVAGYGYTYGGVLVDPSLPITDVHAKIQAVSPGFSHSFGIAGHAASFAAALPWIIGNVKGMVGETSDKVTRVGMGDARLRFAASLLGDTALTPEEYKLRAPESNVGASLVVIMPTGDYTEKHLINIGANRWAIKPEIGATTKFGDWFVEGATGISFFSDNNHFYGGVRRSQDPLATFQFHGGYTFGPGLWLAGDAIYYTGGETTVGGANKHDTQSNSRLGATLSVPLSQGFSLKFAFSKGFTTRIGGDFTTLSAMLQYRWFEEPH